MAVIAVGDFDKASTEKMIRDEFGSIPAPDQRRPRPAFEVPDHAETLFAIATDPEAPISTVGVYNMLPLREQVTVGAYRQRQVERLYVGMMNERLGELTIKPDPPFVRAGIERGIFVRTKEAATMMALVKEDAIARGLTALVTELTRAARFGFTPANSSGSGETCCAATKAPTPNATRRSRPTWRPSSSAPSPSRSRRRAWSMSTAWSSASCPPSRSTRSTRSPRSGPAAAASCWSTRRRRLASRCPARPSWRRR